jgi:tRNA G37 N-methylase TrmD
MDIDVFTLFPEAFDWFGSQRHVRNAAAYGHRLEYVNYRDHTPLTGGQVDDTPFGGGAGMVLRVEHFASDRLSIGRYVLAGGELAAMVVCDAILRKQPGALGHEESALEESFSEALGGAPEYPHYTRPAEYRGWPVPEVLLSGHHANIRQWRLEQARLRDQRFTPGSLP